MDIETQRLDKYLAHRGVCSRRNIKQLLKEQIVTVNGKRVRESGTRINPFKDAIRVNDQRVKQPQFVYYLINKPKDIISTTADEFQRKNVTSLIPTRERIYPVGRLDKDTTGLLILTNDGELTNLLTHPKFHVDKVYQLTIKGKLNAAQVSAFHKGVLLRDGITAPAKVKIRTETPSISIIEMTIHEGKNRQIRRMCETVGVQLLELERIAFGPLSLKGLGKGKYRELTPEEIRSLRRAVK